MIRAARFAYANARLRAMKSRLLRPEDIMALRRPRAAGALASVFRELIGSDVDDPVEVDRVLFGRLVADYAKIIRSYPVGIEVFLALLRLHEIENLKLGWRAYAHRIPAPRWVPYWRPLGSLEILKLEAWREAGSLRQAAMLLEDTVYGDIVVAAFRAHEADPVAAEIAFDRWASVCLVEAAGALPPRERIARALIFALVAERDVEALRRGRVAYGLAPELVIRTAVLLPLQMGVAALRDLVDWTPEAGPLGARVPPALLRAASGIRDWDGLRIALRSERRRACERAFLASPFQLGPAVAFLLLREAEVRGLTALAEARGAPELRMPLNRVLAASIMGA